MKKQLLALMGVGLLACAVQAQDQKAEEKKSAFKDDKEKVSYAIGMNTGMSVKRNDIDIDVDTLIKGVKDSLAGQGQMTEMEMREVFNKLNTELRTRQEEKRKAEAEKNKQIGANFLAANKTKPGVITLPSGLQYKVITEGKGESPKADDMVTVNYRGTLIDGTEFDSSYSRNQPSTTQANRFIRGWTEALQLMKPGAKWELFIPSDIAYGDVGRQPQIPPGATLIFEVELISWKHPEPPASPAPSQPLTSDIIKVPSAEELKKGAKIETIKPEDIEKEKAKERARNNQ